MTRRRREFSIADQLAIIKRAADSSGRIHCQGCGVWCKHRKDYEIDHILAEGMRPAADRKRKLTPADGQLLCVAICHKKKTRRDKMNIAGAKRTEAASLGIVRPGKRKWQHRKKEPRLPARVANGIPALMRRYQ